MPKVSAHSFISLISHISRLFNTWRNLTKLYSALDDRQRRWSIHALTALPYTPACGPDVTQLWWRCYPRGTSADTATNLFFWPRAVPPIVWENANLFVKRSQEHTLDKVTNKSACVVGTAWAQKADPRHVIRLRMCCVDSSAPSTT